MSEFSVPSQFRRALIVLSEKTDDAINELCKLLEKNPDILTSREVAYQHASKLTKFDEDAYPVIEAIVPLMYAKASASKSTAEIVKDITISLTRGDKKASKLPSSAVPKFQKNLSRILDLSGLALKAKALALATDCQRLFTDVKILSDVRPVFGEEISKLPLGAVILHRLRLSYAEDSDERDLYVTLDSSDLLQLQKCIVRALEKDEALHKYAGQMKLQLFETSINQ